MVFPKRKITLQMSSIFDFSCLDATTRVAPGRGRWSTHPFEVCKEQPEDPIEFLAQYLLLGVRELLFCR